MKQETAFNLIGDKLSWTDADYAKEFRELQLMIDHKYDNYQGYQPGTRFHVAMLNWLSQFKDEAERLTAYRFVKARMVFVSQREMHHLIGLMMPTIDRLARKRVARQLDIPLHETYLKPQAEERLELLRRRTLFVGLSDGSRIDVFRRYNEGKISNEQVVAFSEITDSKWDDLQKELVKSLGKLEPVGTPRQAWFEAICLVDDFSGSGSSLLRFDTEVSKWKGKVKKFYDANVDRIDGALAPDCVLHIHHHLASDQARRQITEDLRRFAIQHPKFIYSLSFSHVLSPDIVIDDQCDDEDLTALIRRLYDKDIADDHTGPDIWYGYKQCGLPLVLEHNTPNNSIALLWAESKPDAVPRMKPLFARRKRHSSNG